MQWEDDGHCFVCGASNKSGMRLQFETDDKSIWTTFVPGKEHQGYKEVMHGGILSLLMDEVMVLLPHRLLATRVVSAEMRVRLIRPVPIGERITIRGYFKGPMEPGMRLYQTAAEVTLTDGTLAAEAEGKCVRVG